VDKETFNNTAFGAGDCAEYEGEICQIVSISFTECLFGINQFDDIEDLTWVRCESVNLVRPEVIDIKDKLAQKEG